MGLGGGCREGQVEGGGLGSRSCPPTLGEMDGSAQWVGSAKICVLRVAADGGQRGGSDMWPPRGQVKVPNMEV